MSHQVKWVKRPSIRPDDSGAAATLSRSPVSWAAASRVILERDASTRELPIIDVTPDDTGELDLDDVLAVEVLPGRGPTVSVSATCELQADDVLDVVPLIDRLPLWGVEPPIVEPQAPVSVAPPPWVLDFGDEDLPEAPVDAPPQRRRQVALWIAAATSAASLGVILAAVAVQVEGSAALVLPRSAHHAAAVRTAAARLHAHASQIPVVSLASLSR